LTNNSDTEGIRPVKNFATLLAPYRIFLLGYTIASVFLGTNTGLGCVPISGLYAALPCNGWLFVSTWKPRKPR